MSMYILSLNVSIIVYLQIKYIYTIYILLKKEKFFLSIGQYNMSELLYELIFPYALSNIWSKFYTS